ncbi:HDR020Wp [Eremothecium sinecaudum]|uniref:HDR020Wp n=1 Tax=Eremothecium sinecaudum TaxID=45286 RepID=A0A109UZG5_9SACH|nr:HDR020Wp [Eremothecium sinecaudum]AMD20763.1 HDR020Wp [Eremothecium sinecaudum]
MYGNFRYSAVRTCLRSLRFVGQQIRTVTTESITREGDGRFITKERSFKKGVLNTIYDNYTTTVTYKLEEGQSEPVTVAFSNLFLRDASKSLMSVDPGSGQKLFTTGSLLLNKHSMIPNRVEIVSDGKAVKVDWSDGDSFSYSLEFLHEHSGLYPLNYISKHDPVLWDRDLMAAQIERQLYIDYDSFISSNSSKGLYRSLINLQKYGITFVNNIPEQVPGRPVYVKKIAEHIGNIYHTFYGEIFDVINKSSAENIAYTNHPLPLHMDLLYLENVPGWQLLHAIKNSFGGKESGANYFVNAFRAAKYVCETDIDAYNALKIVPINYGYFRDDKRYYQSRPLIEENDYIESNASTGLFSDLVKCVNYSPPFQKPLTFGIWDKPKDLSVITPHQKLTERFRFRDFQRGLALFEDYINSPENQYRVKLPEGTCVIFDNRKILHARTAFNGKRWLQGCYLNRDCVESKLRYLDETYGK